ncbi:MAG: RagB/SusD family nutrient uptake outer membrane protein [Sphingobacterium sp.]|jgi:tetratricopeptide (TPR) repeat protein|nr:RagB/SusD family nutrient uptake outer membrane protein [Sphingobacterium sp.]
MKTRNIFNSYTIILLLLSVFFSCDKYLSEKPDKSLAIPSTLKDFQALLDNDGSLAWDPNTGEISAGDFYLTQADWKSLSSEPHRRAYLWERDYLFEKYSTDWRAFSTAVYYCNTALEGLQKVERMANQPDQYDDIKGQALFFRAKNVFGASAIWCSAYDQATASKDMGLPLRQNTNFNELSIRSSMQDTYDQIIFDLKKSIPLLPIVPVSRIRPSRPAAYGLLARVYLSMRKYSDAALYADSCLQLYNNLMDYNSLVGSNATYPFLNFNNEVILFGGASTGQILNLSRARIVDELYEQYETDDLRRTLFFTNNSDGSHGFKGRYSGSASLFFGLATDEQMLIKAECLARAKRHKEAMAVLNELLVTRWKSGKFSPLIADNEAQALDIILLERRKGLLFRGLRWLDLKRLNKEGREITLRRTLDGKEYLLHPNDLRYALPIPEDIIEISGMPQNPR